MTPVLVKVRNVKLYLPPGRQLICVMPPGCFGSGISWTCWTAAMKPRCLWLKSRLPLPFLSISMIFYVFAGEHQVILEVVSWCPRLYSPMSAITPLHGTNGRPGRPSLRNLGPQRLSLCCLHIFELLRGCTRGTKKQLNFGDFFGTTDGRL